MGLIKAATGAAGGVLADQWKEYFYCDAISEDTLAVKGQKRTSDRSSNTKGSDNIISSGSVIAVADGQCMLIVEQGKVVEICAEPGEFTFDSSTEPTIFAGNLGTSIVDSLKNIGKRFTFGGEPPKDQRVYYFNTKELIGNKYGTANPVPFKVVDPDINFKLTMRVKCFGEYSYRICDPILLYTNITGNFDGEYKRDKLDSQLKTELLTALQPAFAKLSAMRIEYDQVPAHTAELADILNEELSAKWRELRGIEIVSFGMNSISANEEDEEKLQNAQQAKFYSDASVAGGYVSQAMGDAMRTAAGNESGAMNAFMGMGMANGMGGTAASGLFAAGAQQQQMQQQQQPMQQQPMQQQPMQQQAAPQDAPAAAGWTCSCGATATGKFCPECGSPKPADADGWTCSCGAVNKGKFCQECGAKKPEGVPQYKCDKCGWEPEDPTNPPKFCPECGDPFGDEDII